jgi:hypothetical protein
MNIAAVGRGDGVNEEINRDSKDEIRGDVKTSGASEWLLEEVVAWSIS